MNGFRQEVGGDGPLVEGAPHCCGRCGAALCLRKQVINLALGNTGSMLCLDCLGAEGSRTAVEVLAGIKSYVAARECFRKQWIRYPDVEYCPDPEGCFPGTCFGP